MCDPSGIRIQGKYLAARAQQINQIAPISTTGIEHPHGRCDIASQNLIEDVDIDLSELLLNA